jgi:endoglucanase
MKRSHLEILRSVLACPTAPFREDRVVDLVHQVAARLDHVRFSRDEDGNVLLRYRHGRKRPRPLVLQAHLDHPGFLSLEQRRTGRLEALFRGRVDRDRFAGARVVFHGLEVVRARIVSVRKPRGSDDLVATLDAEDRVERGTIGTWDAPACRIRGDRLETRAADDLTGVAAILCVLEDLAREGAATEVLAVLTRAEEVGFAGTLGLVRRGDVPAGSPILNLECSRALKHVRPGDGPVIRVGDRRTTYTPRFTETLVRIARGFGPRFRVQRALMDGGACEATVFGLHGYEVAALCLATENFHNQTAGGSIGPERVRLSDLAGMIRLTHAAAREPLDLGALDRETRERLDRRYETLREELRHWERSSA